MELLHDAPVESTFIPVSEHQSQTPASFYSGPPVLHFRNTHGQLLCPKEEASRHPAIEKLIKDSTGYAESWLVDGLDIWVSSEKLIFWNSSASLGITIPYPSISLHALGSIASPSDPATKSQALYLEIVATDGFDDHDEEGSIALNYLPSSSSQLSSHTARNADADAETTPASVCQQLFDAVTDCANLHPDPVSPSSSQAEEEDSEEGPTFDYEVLDGDGGLPPAFPGSGGWITSENMDQFFDEEGNWRGQGLGPGAGMVRPREEEFENGVNGDSEEINGEEDTKWRRTD